MFNWFSEPNFKTVLFELVWLSWLFDASWVSRFILWCDNSGCELMQPHTCTCKMCIISRFIISDSSGGLIITAHTSPYIFWHLVVKKKNFSCVLDGNTQFLCSLESFKLSNLGVRHPSRVAALLDFCSARHSPTLVFAVVNGVAGCLSA